MRASAHAAHVFAHIIAHDAILKFLLPIALGAGRLCRISRELGMGAGFRWGGLGAGQVCDQQNYATGNKGADGLQAASWDVASDPSILFLRIGIIELETKHLDMKILLSIGG